jgi:hypothetical protein
MLWHRGTLCTTFRPGPGRENTLPKFNPGHFVLQKDSHLESFVCERHICTLATKWHENLKVHHHIHNSLPPVPILSLSNAIHTLQPISLTFWSNPPTYTLVFRVVSFLWAYPPKPCTLFSPTSVTLTWTALWYLGMSRDYEAPHCATSSTLLKHSQTMLFL